MIIKKFLICGNIIEYGSFKHWIYYLAADKNISSHKEGNPNHMVFTILHLYLNLFNNRVFLQHGITKDNVPMFYYKNTKFKLFICGAKEEYEYIKNVFGYPNDNIVYTGFARFDNLHKINVDKKKILIIPTWRRWFELFNENDREKFEESEYYQRWNEILKDTELIEYTKKNDIEILFFPHYQMKKYVNSFQTVSNNIKIIKQEDIDIQVLLKESALMITDYSSVYMDFAYMNKPVIYYQFDYDRYRESHLKEGYFNYKENGFGEVVYHKQALVNKIIDYINCEFKVSEQYQKRMNSFFELNDSNNCNRIYEKIKKIG